MRGLIALLALVTTAACSNAAADIEAPEARLPAARLTVLSGNSQITKIGSSLPEPIRVRLDTAGIPAPSAYLEFVFTGYTSPGPNHYWFATTDAAGVASANGTIINTIPGPATITIKYTVCVVPGFKSCSREVTRATAVVPAEIVQR